MKCVVIIFAALISQSIYSQNYNLSISIAELKSREGEIQIGLYNNNESFPLVDKQYKLFFINAAIFEGIYTIKGLPGGQYAVAVFHDKNSDRICNTNFLGIPKEGYGFSKNFRPKFSSPSFNDCKIDLDSNMSITIKLIY